jgi:hypothetical protein
MIMFWAAAGASAQPVTFGLKIGLPLNDLLDAASPVSALRKPKAFGGVAELNLPAGLGIETNLLYRRAGYDQDGRSTRASGWEIPMLLKYKGGSGLVRPTVSVGYAFRSIGDLQKLGRPLELFEQNKTSRGFVLGTGLRISAVVLKLWPEIRYTRWNNSWLTTPQLDGSRNQLEFLLGFTF